MRGIRRRPQISPEQLFQAYASGLFPMADSAEDPDLYWVQPKWRGVIPLDRFHISKRLQRTVRQDVFEVRVDTDFERVIDGCADSAPGREKTWINGEIRRLYGEMFAAGHVHTVESWQDGVLVGGLYGLSLGGAFFGESMFSRATDASKVALVHLVARLIAGGYTLLDTQFITGHLMSFGAEEIPQAIYLDRLAPALDIEGNFHALPPEIPGREALDWVERHAAPV